MKYFFFSIPIFVAMLLSLVSCGSGKNDLEKVAYGYCMATAEYRFEDAEAFCTEETKNTALGYAKYIVSIMDTTYFVMDSPVSIDIMSIEITSDTSAFAVYHKRTPIKDFTDTLEMRKRDGRWLAHAPCL